MQSRAKSLLDERNLLVDVDKALPLFPQEIDQDPRQAQFEAQQQVRHGASHCCGSAAHDLPVLTKQASQAVGLRAPKDNQLLSNTM